MLSCCLLLQQKRRQCFSNLVLSNFGQLVQIKASDFLFSSDRNRFSAAVAHLLQSLACCAFSDTLCHSLVVISNYLSYCCIHISLNPSVHSPNIYQGRELLLTECFNVWRIFLTSVQDNTNIRFCFYITWSKMCTGSLTLEF